MNAAFGVLINDDSLFYKNIICRGIRAIGVFDPTSAASGLNYILNEMGTENDIGILIHQDVEFKDDWLQVVESKLNELPENWMVAGLWGVKAVEEHKNYYGNIIDARMARKVGSDKPVGVVSGPLPIEVDALDEVCLIVNLKYGFRFDESYRGFDLYGTYICLWAQKHGYSAWAIDAPLVHNTKRTWAWKPDQVFLQNWDKLDKAFPWPEYKVMSTVY
jgi:hypothetical protein